MLKNILLLSFLTSVAPTYCQNPVQRAWYAGLDLGYGRLSLASDQHPNRRIGTLAMAFRGGRAVTRHLRIGVELNGWLIEAFDPNDPAKGESVSNALLICQIVPIPSSGGFIKFGIGSTTYTNEHPLLFDSKGISYTVGLGYEIRLSKGFYLAPIMTFTTGSFKDVYNMVAVQTGQKYSVWDVRISTMYHWGRP